jgi:hypothetical protein
MYASSSGGRRVMFFISGIAARVSRCRLLDRTIRQSVAVEMPIMMSGMTTATASRKGGSPTPSVWLAVAPKSLPLPDASE